MLSIWKLPIALIVILVVCLVSYVGLGVLISSSGMFMAGCGIQSYFTHVDIWFLIAYLFYLKSTISFSYKNHDLLFLKEMPYSFLKDLYLSNLLPAIMSNLIVILPSLFQGTTCTFTVFVIRFLINLFVVPFTSVILAIFSLISYFGIAFLLRYLKISIPKPK